MKLIPVIHYLDDETTLKNAKICNDLGVYGIFLISMEGENENLPTMADLLKSLYPNLKIGLNLLGVSAIESVKVSQNFNLDMTWSDNPIVTSELIFNEAKNIQKILNKNHLFFNSVAFKYQKVDNNPGLAALNSKKLGFIPTTSGVATGKSVDLEKVKNMKNEIEDYPLALASGIDEYNISSYKNIIDFGLISTGISKDFYNFDYIKLENCLKNIC